MHDSGRDEQSSPSCPIRSRRTPISSSASATANASRSTKSKGYHSATLVNMALCALRLNRTLRFDPAKQLFVGDDAANRLIDQPMRAPWKI